MAEKNILFEILNSLFTNKEYINNLTPQAMKQYAFMINRRIAIKYPLQAQVFNNNKVYAPDVIKFWSDFLYTGKRPQGWVYTAGAAKSQAKKAEKSKVTPTMIKEYSLKYNISQKDVATALKLFTEEIVAEMLENEEIKKQLSTYEKDNN